MSGKKYDWFLAMEKAGLGEELRAGCLPSLSLGLLTCKDMNIYLLVLLPMLSETLI